MATFGEVMREGGAVLREAGSEHPLQEAALLLCDVGSMNKAQLVMQENDACPDDLISQYTSRLIRRIKGESVHRIMGGREFHGLHFQLNDETLEPRDDTEALIELVLSLIEDRSAPFRIADLGTGPGTIALSLLAELPNARVVATDASEKALDMARYNAQNLGLHERMFAAQGDWCHALSGLFDILVSNPPYIASDQIEGLADEVREHDPRLALDGGEDGLDAYREIFANADMYLNAGGFLAVEIGYDQRESVSELGAENGWILRHVNRDLGGYDRALAFLRA